jgi:hypothetical protein
MDQKMADVPAKPRVTPEKSHAQDTEGVWARVQVRAATMRKKKHGGRRGARGRRGRSCTLLL